MCITIARLEEPPMWISLGGLYLRVNLEYFYSESPKQTLYSELYRQFSLDANGVKKVWSITESHSWYVAL